MVPQNTVTTAHKQEKHENNHGEEKSPDTMNSAEWENELATCYKKGGFHPAAACCRLRKNRKSECLDENHNRTCNDKDRRSQESALRIQCKRTEIQPVDDEILIRMLGVYKKNEDAKEPALKRIKLLFKLEQLTFCQQILVSFGFQT